MSYEPVDGWMDGWIGGLKRIANASRLNSLEPGFFHVGQIVRGGSFFALAGNTLHILFLLSANRKFRCTDTGKGKQVAEMLCMFFSTYIRTHTHAQTRLSTNSLI